MSSRGFIAVLLSCLLIFLSACSLPGSLIDPISVDPAQATAAIQTSVAQIVAATLGAQTQMAGQNDADNAAQTETANSAAATLVAMGTTVPEATFTPSATATLKFTSIPFATSTPIFPRVSFSVETNCRSGPGKVYPVLAVLKPGESAEVLGQDLAKGNWIIRLPSNPTTVCWVWRSNATIYGETTQVPIFTAQPPPTPENDFTLTFDSVVDCSGQYAIKFKIVNKAGITWESNQVNLTDQTTNATTTINRDTFPNFSGCIISIEDQNLEPGESGTTMSQPVAVIPTGHSFKATVQVCGQNGQGGVCAAKTITFTP